MLPLLVFSVSQPTAAPQPSPLTEIVPTTAELEAFAGTLSGGIEQLRRQGHQLAPRPVVHVVGASPVEASVDYGAACQETSARLVLVGPTVPETSVSANTELAKGCISATVRNLYSSESVSAALQDRADLSRPDMILLHNADLYMPYWRRTLAEFLQLQVPVIVTMYCEYEGHKLERLLNWVEVELSAEGFASCDRLIRANFDEQLAHEHQAAGRGTIPDPRILWPFTANPHAHEAPRNCYSEKIMRGLEHGVRNAYWIAFIGGSLTAASVHSGHVEL
eukprot:SAG31_NODE_3336_length_4391_cov_1.826887_2_plen_278_part_00